MFTIKTVSRSYENFPTYEAALDFAKSIGLRVYLITKEGETNAR